LIGRTVFTGEKTASIFSYLMFEYLLIMKTLQFQRDEKKSRVMVDCAEGNVSVYSHCAYCKHCIGIRVGKRLAPTPQVQALADVRRGSAEDDVLMNAAMMFNTLVRDGTAVECDDDANEGFRKLF
jgi:hypothetical protein